MRRCNICVLFQRCQGNSCNLTCVFEPSIYSLFCWSAHNNLAFLTILPKYDFYGASYKYVDECNGHQRSCFHRRGRVGLHRPLHDGKPTLETPCHNRLTQICMTFEALGVLLAATLLAVSIFNCKKASNVGIRLFTANLMAIDLLHAAVSFCTHLSIIDAGFYEFLERLERKNKVKFHSALICIFSKRLHHEGTVIRGSDDAARVQLLLRTCDDIVHHRVLQPDNAQ